MPGLQLPSYRLPDNARLPIAAAVGLLMLSHRLWKGIDFAGKPKVLRAPERRNEEPYPADIYPGGKDLDTPYGRIRYYQFGPADGKKLMLVHGISTPAPAWRKLVPLLVKAGYRLLIFDLFGRGYSDTPVVPHDVALKVAQIALVLADLPDWDKFDLCGMSLGGPIVSNFAHYFPNRIDRLVLLCPAGGLPRTQLPLARRIILSNLIPQPLLNKLVYVLPIRPIGDLGNWQVNKHKGFMHSFTSSLREGPIFNNAEVHQAVVKSFGPRVRAVWGDDDTIVPMSTSKYFGELDVRVVPGGGHWIILTHPEEVAKHMLEFLDAKP